MFFGIALLIIGIVAGAVGVFLTRMSPLGIPILLGGAVAGVSGLLILLWPLFN